MSFLNRQEWEQKREEDFTRRNKESMDECHQFAKARGWDFFFCDYNGRGFTITESKWGDVIDTLDSGEPRDSIYSSSYVRLKGIWNKARKDAGYR